jgi:dTDP-4-amino-4,6-dideoxygalactose transaminase
VVTTPLTFAATANAVLYAGGKPVFADIAPDTWCLSPERAAEVLDGLEAEGRTVGLAPVHFAGLPAGVAAFREMARERGLFLVEDASHALGARWRDERGDWHGVGEGGADATTLSFHPVKHVTTAEGGAILTPHGEVARAARELRHHGIVRDPARMERPGPGWYHEMQSLGLNYRLTDVQCALGRVQLGRLDGFVDRRRALAERYRELLAGEPRVTPQAKSEDGDSSWHLFAVRVPRRDAVFEHMRGERIGVQVHYLPVYLHPFYRGLGFPAGLCPEAESVSADLLSLPLYPDLTDAEQDRVVDTLRRGLDRIGDRSGEVAQR